MEHAPTSAGRREDVRLIVLVGEIKADSLGPRVLTGLNLLDGVDRHILSASPGGERPFTPPTMLWQLGEGGGLVLLVPEPSRTVELPWVVCRPAYSGGVHVALGSGPIKLRAEHASA